MIGSDSNQSIERLAGRFAEQPERCSERVTLPQSSADGGELAEFAERAAETVQHQIGRRIENDAAQHVGEAAHLGLPDRITRGVSGAEFRDLAFGPAFAGEKVTPVRQRQEILRAAFDDAQSVFVQFQVADDFRLQQTDSVSRGRIAEAGVKFLRHRSSADHASPFQHAHAQAGHAEIGRARQPVVAGSDYDDIEIGHGCLEP